MTYAIALVLMLTILVFQGQQRAYAKIKAQKNLRNVKNGRKAC